MAPSLAVGSFTFLFAILWGGPLIKYLRRHGIGEQIRIDGPRSHQVKTGTPTMGGIMIIGPVVTITLILLLIDRAVLSLAPELLGGLEKLIGKSILLPLGILVAYGTLGGLDDLAGIARRREAIEAQTDSALVEKTGFVARLKFAWQVAMATIAAFILYYLLGLRGVGIPTIPRFIDLGFWYIPAAIFIIVGSSNAVNFTDGLDGLAGGTSAIAFVAYGIIAYLQGQVYLALFCFTVVGAVLAFLWFNAYPAQLFMGNVGSLALGATLGVVALMTGQWLLLPIVGIVFVAETMSVIMQVAYFKLTKGRRIFKMSPLHHHFELLGWSEVQVVQRFWLLAMLAAMLGIALALI
ncbi:MAG: phospho-N-acetylmuramoyl-pentapeptide-transferase [Anaerolineae bacterium]